MKTEELKGKFEFKKAETTPVPSCLYEEHLKLTKKALMADFAGYLMPLWYSSISSEHNTTRQACGVFDCTHMGAIEFAGPQAHAFVNIITTNDIDRLIIGQAQYAYILDASGAVLDDVIIYKRGDENYMMVVNAANTEKIKAWLKELKNCRQVIDEDGTRHRIEPDPIIRDMKYHDSCGECRVDIALQGPTSLQLLTSLADSKLKSELTELKPFHFIERRLDSIDCIISRTGYTGSRLGYELLVHPENAAPLWTMLLEADGAFAIAPCGLGARDSLRIEAGLPLYGHELAGPFDISPLQAGYGWAVKLDKDFFIGKKAMENTADNQKIAVARLSLPGQKGLRPVRSNDAVLNAEGKCVGWILSNAKIQDRQIALACLHKDCCAKNTEAGLYYLARNKRQLEDGRKQKVEAGQVLQPDIKGKVVSRFAKF